MAHDERYSDPARQGQPELHVFQSSEDTGEWEVWLNTGVADFDGLCVGVGSTRDEAILDAAKVLRWGRDALHVAVVSRDYLTRSPA